MYKKVLSAVLRRLGRILLVEQRATDCSNIEAQLTRFVCFGSELVLCVLASRRACAGRLADIGDDCWLESTLDTDGEWA